MKFSLHPRQYQESNSDTLLSTLPHDATQLANLNGGDQPHVQRHALFVQSGVHDVVLGDWLHPQQDHDKGGQEVDMEQSPAGG